MCVYRKERNRYNKWLNKSERERIDIHKRRQKKNYSDL